MKQNGRSFSSRRSDSNSLGLLVMRTDDLTQGIQLFVGRPSKPCRRFEGFEADETPSH